MRKVYIIGVGGIGISGIARYYNENGYKVYGSDLTDSELIKKMQSEGIDIIIGERSELIDDSFEKIIYTEAIPKTQSELKKSLDLNIKTLTYPQALGEVANAKKLVAVAGTHGKSTTSSITSLVFKDSQNGLNALIGSILTEFDGKNVCFESSDYFVIEACEYKRSFLNYKPFIGAITNIEIDHLDYYKDLEDYISAYDSFIGNIRENGYVILDKNCENSMSLNGKRKDIHYIILDEKKYQIFKNNELIGEYFIPDFQMQIPGNHIKFDANIAYISGKITGIKEEKIIKSIESYTGIWRRSEIVGITENNNILMSDYGHHPTEISLNLKALKGKYVDKKILTIFQPHQYSRTLELLEDFKNCFRDTDILIIPDIYESRDSTEDKAKINGEKLVKLINHSDKLFGNGLKNTLKLIQKYDKENPGELVIILQGAGNVDNLRYEINLK